MKIRLLKDLEKQNGKVIPTGREMEVANFYALEMIAQGRAEAVESKSISYPTLTKDSVEPIPTDEEE